MELLHTAVLGVYAVLLFAINENDQRGAPCTRLFFQSVFVTFLQPPEVTIWPHLSKRSLALNFGH